MSNISRRTVLGTGSAFFGLSLAGWPTGAFAADPLQVFGHKTHETMSISGAGGDTTAPWTAETGTPIAWTTFDIGPLQERLLRELSLNQTTLDIGYVLNTQMTQQLAGLFEPLDDYQEKDPIENFEDIFPGFVEGMRVGGKLLSIPSRGPVPGLHYNEEILAKRGFSKGPETIEELAEIAKACTYTEDGVSVVGYAIPLNYVSLVQMARAWNGDLITPDFKSVVQEPPMVKTVAMLADLYAAGALPRNVTSMTSEDPLTWMQTGRAAMYPGGFNRAVVFNDPEKSQFPGKIKNMPMPTSEETRAELGPYAPGTVEIWGMIIPKNGLRKDLAWSFIKHMSSNKMQLDMQFNGNATVRRSVYENEDIRKALSYADAAKAALDSARVALPAFDNATRVADLFNEQVHLAVLGQKTAEQAMADADAAIQPLLPA
ncbi:MAG: extracellular solute-binding protein [Hyphomicrobiales bacterium]|nr:MAG: extracellular solute-binding protein [Hyphomicrobiales bacterium]